MSNGSKNEAPPKQEQKQGREQEQEQEQNQERDNPSRPPIPLRQPKMRDQLWSSIFRHGAADSTANRILAIAGNLWLHLHPARIPGHALRFRFTLCAGGITFLLFLVTVVTGAVLMLYYRPAPLLAHRDLIDLGQVVPFGAFLRSLHRYAGDGMIIALFVHMIRVLLTGSYKKPREFNWVVGVALLVLTLAIAFTGYLLPWDEKGYWATTVAANMIANTPVIGAEGPLSVVGPNSDLRAAVIGGAGVGPWTLVRFYSLHCVVLPLAAALIMALHFWRVRKDGISGPL